MPDVFFDVDAVIIAVQVAQARITAAESSVQIAYLSVNDRVELDIKYADELGRSIASLPILCTCFVFRPH
jgi:nuclear pore complex protein Nup210